MHDLPMAIDQVIARPWRGLKLVGDLESQFEAATCAARVASTRQFLGIALAADLLALGLDYAHGSFTTGLLLRLGVVAPAILLAIGFLSAARSVWLQGLLTGVPVLLGLSSIVLIGLTMNGRFPELYLSAAGMAGFLVNAALPLRFRHAVILTVATIVTMIALVATCHGSNDPGSLMGTLLFNCLMLVLTLQLTYRTERSNKMAFLFGRQDQQRAEALAHANTELQRLATTDPLTGLLNRRALGEAMERCRAGAHERSGGYAFLLIDVDRFKQFNDTAGHSAGDACLQSVASTIVSQVRPGTDAVGRYGGEEFAIVIPDADPRMAKAVAERIRTAVQHRALPHPGLQKGRCVTVSIGAAATLDTDAGEIQRLIRRADDALYQAKGLGRNAVVVDGAALPVHGQDASSEFGIGSEDHGVTCAGDLAA